MKVGFNEGIIQPRLSVSGDIAIGFGPNPFLSKLSGTVEIANDRGYFYSEIDKFSFEALYLAFNIKHELLEVLRDSKFPNGMVGGFSFPKGKRISSLGVNLDPSFTLKGKAIILGNKLFCKVQVSGEANLQISGKFKKLDIANGLIQLTSKDRSSGPLLNININASTVEFKIKAYVKVLKMGAVTDIVVADSGIRFNIVGMLLGLFTTNVSFIAPYREFSKLSGADFEVKTCIDDETVKKIQQVAIREINESVVISNHAKDENTKRYEDAENWLRKGLTKVEKWRNQMADREIKLDNKLKELDDFKKKLSSDCVEECSKNKITVGGIGLKTCIIGKQKIKCPYWIEKKKTRDDPLCLAKCEVKSVFRRKKWNTLMRKSDLENLQAEIKHFAKLGKKAQSFFEATQSLVERAKETSIIVGDVGRAGIKAAKAIDKYSIKNMIQIDNLCMGTTLAGAKGGCFMIDFTVYIGARHLKKVLSDNVEACLNKNFGDELGQIIAYQAFPRLAPVKKKYERIKDLLDDIDDDAQTILSKSKELEAEEKKLQSRSLQDDDTAECEIVDYDRDLPEFVLRDDRTMQAFRDIFNTDDDDDDDNEGGSDLNEASIKTVNTKGSGTNNNALKEEAASADTSPPATRDDLERCKQMQDIMDVYKEISNSASFLLAENKYLKGSYEAFIKENLLKFDMLEGSTMKEARSLNLSREEEDDALFYIGKGKEGIASWKANFDEKYEQVDKLSLHLWRQFIAKTLSKKRKVVERLFELLRSASSTVSRRYEISHPLKESMKHAHRVANHLFEEAGSISSMAGHIYELADHVHYMLQLKKEIKC